MLAKCWVSISTDPVIGNEQNSSHFWGRIHDLYQTNKGSVGPDRTQKSLTNRWCEMMKLVSRFHVSWCHVRRLNHNGKNDHDMLEDAIRHYEETMKTRFPLMHVWDVVKRDKKWISCYTTEDNNLRRSAKKQRGMDSTSSPVVSSPSSMGTPDEDIEPYCQQIFQKPKTDSKGKSKETDDNNSTVVEVLTRMQEAIVQCIEERKQEQLEKVRERMDKADYRKRAIALAEAKFELEKQEQAARLELERCEKEARVRIEERRAQFEEDERIMTMNSSDMKLSELQREWIIRRQKEILARGSQN